MTNYVIYTFADICNAKYLCNTSLKDLPTPIHFLCSNGVENQVIVNFPDAIILETENHMQNKFINFLKQFTDTTKLVKIDLDAVIFDKQKFIQEIEDTNQNEFRGNLRTVKRGTYIRGGFNCIWSQELFKINLQPSGNPMDVDIWLALQLKETQLINRPYFEINNKYTGTAPVWHPLQDANKWVNFKKHLDFFNLTQESD